MKEVKLFFKYLCVRLKGQLKKIYWWQLKVIWVVLNFLLFAKNILWCTLLKTFAYVYANEIMLCYVILRLYQHQMLDTTIQKDQFTLSLLYICLFHMMHFFLECLTRYNICEVKINIFIYSLFLYAMQSRTMRLS